MAKGKKNKTNSYILFGIAIILIAISLFVVIKTLSKRPLKVQEFDVFFIVDVGGIGIDVNNTLLTFGQVNPGGGGRRTIVIDNTYNFPIEVKTLVSKNLLGLIDTNYTFIVEHDKNITIPVELEVPSDFPLGNYTGKIRFEMYELD